MRHAAEQRKEAGPRAPSAAPVRRRMRVGPASDDYERAADAAAHEVVQRLRSGQPGSTHSSAGARLAHAPGCSCCSGTAQRRADIGDAVGAAPIGSAGGELDADTSAIIAGASRHGGAPLADGVQRGMEGAFGSVDFSSVRVHTDDDATMLNRQMQASAFTHGSHIFFRDGLPDASSASGQELLAHELAHTLQQDGPVSRTVRRKKGALTPPAGKAVDDDWVEYSGGTKPSRSKELKAIDTAVAAWVKSGKTMGGAVDLNVTQLGAIKKAIDDWRNAKKGGTSVRDIAIADLLNLVNTRLAHFAQKKADQATADTLHGEFSKLDAETKKFAAKNTTDVQSIRYLPGSQTPGLMAHTKKNADGTLTAEGLKALDDQQIDEATELKQKAQGFKVNLDPSVTPDKVKDARDKKTNAISGRTDFPELLNLTDPNTEQGGEITESISVAGSTFKVTYDKSDVNAAERLAALQSAVQQVSAAGGKVPNLEVYFPKYGRDLSIAGDCKVTEGKKIADAVFHPPGFFAVSSATVGSPKVDMQKDGEYRNLSSRLATAPTASDALVNTVIHEMGHVLHYHHDRGRFYNLNFARFAGKHTDGRTYQTVAEEEVSQYGSNPREMVAEVFLGTVTGKKQFPQIVWSMYLAFGGDPAIAPGAAKPLDTTGASDQKATKSKSSKTKATATGDSTDA